MTFWINVFIRRCVSLGAKRDDECCEHAPMGVRLLICACFQGFPGHMGPQIRCQFSCPGSTSFLCTDIYTEDVSRGFVFADLNRLSVVVYYTQPLLNDRNRRACSDCAS